MYQDTEIRGLKTVASLMCVAARTAPKTKGVDNLVISIIEGSEKEKLVEEMIKISREKNHPHFKRDAINIKESPLMVLIGTRLSPLDLRICNFCGFNSCAELKKSGGVCAFNSGDLSLAVGSAVSVATNHRVDNRIMYTAGMASINLGMQGKEVKIAYGIPLSATGKNPFFDRKEN